MPGWSWRLRERFLHLEGHAEDHPPKRWSSTPAPSPHSSQTSSAGGTGQRVFLPLHIPVSACSAPSAGTLSRSQLLTGWAAVTQGQGVGLGTTHCGTQPWCSTAPGFPRKKPIPKQLSCFPALGAHLLWVQVQLSSQVFAGAHGLGQPRGAEHPTADRSRATGKSQRVKNIPCRHPKSL